MLFPAIWRKMIGALATLPAMLLHRFGSGLVVSDCIIYYMLRSKMGAQWEKQLEPARKSTENRGFR